MDLRVSHASFRADPTLQETEVGLLPQDWRAIRLATHADIQSGIAKNANATLRDPITVPYLRVANVQDGFLDLTEVSTIDIERGDLNRYAVLPGDVLMNEGGDLDKLGRGAIWTGLVSPCVHQNHVFVVRCKSELVPDYLNAWTSSAQARRYFMLAGRQTTNLASINKTSLGELIVAVPPTNHEQKAIAKALTDADALIDALEQLLTKKRQIKQGVMQELLTGKRRLPGFSEPWKGELVKHFGEIVTGGTPSTVRKEFWGEEYPWITPTDISTVRDMITSERSVTQEGLNAIRLLPADTVLVTCIASIGKNAILRSTGGCNQQINAIIPNDRHCAEFIYFLMEASKQYLLSKAGTTATAILSKAAFSEMHFFVPLKAEQTAIAQALSDMDADLTALESRLTKARALKQAMAQALLTGRIRLVEPQRS